MKIRPHQISDYKQLAELRLMLKSGDCSIVDDEKNANFLIKYIEQLKSSDALGDTHSLGT